ncbi:hypothetical protein [Flavobacterium ginsenosidimutans]|uniref:Uncharacterized protein n=1 Tax=Flavobacterium ginsenosidimutans TaxID=687844 RepID=A0ABZ2Q3R8_9FLAO
MFSNFLLLTTNALIIPPIKGEKCLNEDPFIIITTAAIELKISNVFRFTLILKNNVIRGSKR